MRIISVVVFIIGLFSPVAAFCGEEFIGGLRNVQGVARVERGTRQFPAENGFRVHLGDVLITGKDGAMGIVFKDDTRISLGPDSKLTITRFVYQPADEKFSFISRLIRGTAAYISGAIGRTSPDSVKFETPVATIGIRGTTFLAKIEPE